MRKLINIGELANLFNIETSKIRYYEKEGLLFSQRDKISGYRQYDFKDVERLENILLLRDFGVSLSEIKNLKSGYGVNEYLELLNNILVETDKEILQLKKRKRKLEGNIRFVEKFEPDVFIIAHKDERKMFIDRCLDDSFKTVKDLYDYHFTNDYNFTDYDIDIYFVKENDNAFTAFSKPRKKTEMITLQSGDYLSIYSLLEEDFDITDTINKIIKKANNSNYTLDGISFLKLSPETALIDDKEYMLFEAKIKSE